MTLPGSLHVVAVFGMIGAGCAQPPPPKAPAPQTVRRPAPPPAQPIDRDDRNVPAVDPDALAALREMGAFLRAQRAFTIRSTAETDEVLESGQKIQLGSRITLDVRRPDRLHADIVSDRKVRQFFYDGDRFTIYAPRMGYYATIPAPDSIPELLELIAQRYGIEFPLADLFVWGTDRAPLDRITSAIYIGPSTINGVETDQYAFRQPGLNWQVWIARGPYPVPRKLVLTTTDDPTQPQHVVVMDWDLRPVQDERLFRFVPPANSQRIEFAAPTTAER